MRRILVCSSSDVFSIVAAYLYILVVFVEALQHVQVKVQVKVNYLAKSYILCNVLALDSVLQHFSKNCSLRSRDLQ